MIKTVVVWTLYIYTAYNRGGGPAIIDNISSKRNCEIVAEQIRFTNQQNRYNQYDATTTRCIPIRKVVTNG